MTLINPFKTWSVLLELKEERERQDARFGQQEHGPFHWISLLTEEVGEAAQAANDAWFPGTGIFNYQALALYRAELIQSAALAAAAVESLDRWVAQINHEQEIVNDAYQIYQRHAEQSSPTGSSADPTAAAGSQGGDGPISGPGRL